MNNNYIKEFWEWSKNSYGQDKSNKEAMTSLVSYNQQNGYAEEGQWALTQDGTVFIETIEDGTYKGFDKKGNPMTGSVKDIIRTILKRDVILKESISIKDLYEVGQGTEGIVYSDGEFAYKVSSVSVQGNPNEIMERVKTHPNIVKIYDAFLLPEDIEYVVIKMELLSEIDEQLDMNNINISNEYRRVESILFNRCDNEFEGKGEKELMKLKSSHPEIQKMIDSIREAYKEIGYLDIGFHNLMYDKKSGNYKQIDI